MYINGIGRVSKKEIESIFSPEGKAALRLGEISWKEAGEMYKYNQVKKVCIIGDNIDTFSTCYDRIPDALKDKLTPSELALLVDAFYECYGDGKRSC